MKINLISLINTLLLLSSLAFAFTSVAKNRIECPPANLVKSGANLLKMAIDNNRDDTIRVTSFYDRLKWGTYVWAVGTNVIAKDYLDAIEKAKLRFNKISSGDRYATEHSDLFKCDY